MPPELSISFTDVVHALLVLCAVASSGGFVATGVGRARARRREAEFVRASAAHETPDVIPPLVSIIIAAHDEVQRIPALIAALQAQTYPRERMDIVVADDRSTDGTAQVVAHLDPAVRIVRIDVTPAGVSPKKHALHTAIEAATAEFLLFTDADCRPGPDWVRAMVRRLAGGAEVVVGLSPVDGIRHGAQLLRGYESARASMLMVAAIGWEAPYMSLGRNWGYLRRSYEAVGGLPSLGHHLGGDDDLLLQRYVSAGAHIASCTERDAACPTDPPAGWGALLRMRVRHLHVAAAYRGRGALLLAGFELAEFITIFIAPAWFVVTTGMHPLLVAVVLVAKLSYDTRFLLPAMRGLPGRGGICTRLIMILLEPLHVASTVLFSVLAPLLRSRW